MRENTFCVLFVCTGNSTRSLLAEGMINRYRAGRRLKGEMYALTEYIREKYNFFTDGLRSKDWSEFSTADGPVRDFKFTVSDKAAQAACAIWAGHPITAHFPYILRVNHERAM